MFSMDGVELADAFRDDVEEVLDFGDDGEVATDVATGSSDDVVLDFGCDVSGVLDDEDGNDILCDVDVVVDVGDGGGVVLEV